MTVTGTPVLRIAPPYDDELITYITQKFSLKYNRELSFSVIEDNSLLCGFVAYIDGTVYDVSGITKLRGVASHLLKLFSDSGSLAPSTHEVSG